MRHHFISISWLGNLVVLSSLGSTATWFPNGHAASLELQEGVLTVEQTTGLAFIGGGHMPTRHLFARANPGAREPLRRVLADESLRSYHANVWRIMSYIGDDSDLESLEPTVRDKFVGILSRDQRDSLRAMSTALGGMCRRNVPGARELTDKWVDAGYWKNAKFQINGRPSPSDLPNEYEIVGNVLSGYTASGDPDALRRIRAAKEAIDDPVLLAKIGQSLVAIERIAENMDPNQDLDLPGPTDHERHDLEARFDGNLERPRPRERKLVVAYRSLPDNGPGVPPVPAKVDWKDDEWDDVDTLELTGPRVTAADIRRAARSPRLESLKIMNAPITDEGLAELRRSRSLWSLTILDCPRVSDAGFAHVGSLKSLGYLHLNALPEVTDRGIGHLEGLEKLNALSLTRIRITDAGIESLKGLSQLEQLQINDAPIDGTGFVHLKGLTKLQSLILMGTRLTDEGLAHLEGLPNLRDLMVVQRPIGSYRSEITDAGVARFQRARPDCKVRR